MLRKSVCCNIVYFRLLNVSVMFYCLVLKCDKMVTRAPHKFPEAKLTSLKRIGLDDTNFRTNNRWVLLIWNFRKCFFSQF